MKVTVPLGGRSYAVHVGNGLIQRVPQLAEIPRAGGVAIVGDRRLDPVMRRLARAFEQAGTPAPIFAVRANESLKSLDALAPLYGKLLRAGFDRRATIVGVGGGTIGDAIGFLAATYLRGVRFVSVPTTLLAGVDSAIGGKTGVNHPLGKNLIGVFSQPSVVIVDPALLRTLDRRDRISGVGEIVKYGLIADPKLFRKLQSHWHEIVALRSPITTATIARCVELKAEVVGADERERTGIREQLNFGHTVAHALEQVAGYGRFRHGEAVIIGMRAAVALSAVRETLAPRTAHEIDAFLAKLPVPAGWRRYDARAIAAATRHDKKRTAKGVRFVLLDEIGHTVSDDGVQRTELLHALREIGFQ